MRRLAARFLCALTLAFCARVGAGLQLASARDEPALDGAGDIRVPEGATVRREDFFTTYRSRLGIGPYDTFVQYKDSESKIPGRRFGRYAQRYRNVPVIGGDYIVHYRSVDGLAKSGIGRVIRGLDLSTTPAISQARALGTCDDALAAELRRTRPVSLIAPAIAELVLASPSEDYRASQYRLTWRCVMRPTDADSWIGEVDAMTGSLLSLRSGVLKDFVPVQLMATSKYNGPVQFDAEYDAALNVSQLSQPAVITYEGSPGAVVAVTGQDFNAYTDAVSAHWAMGRGLAYFQGAQNAPQCLPTQLPLYVNPGGIAAGFDPANGLFKFNTPYVALEIVAHELAHCVQLSYWGPSVYGGENGALMESFGDIFGEAVERFETGQNDWVLSNQTFPLDGYARNMKAPLQSSPAQPDTYQGQPLWAATSPILESNDHGGTHMNCSVQSKWFQLLAEGALNATSSSGLVYSVKGIGFDDAAAFTYAYMTEFLTASSTYSSARDGATNAAIELCGQFSKLRGAVHDAWWAVGLNSSQFTGYGASLPADGQTDVDPWDLQLSWQAEGPKGSEDKWTLTLAKSPDLTAEMTQTFIFHTKTINGQKYGFRNLDLDENTTYYWTVWPAGSPGVESFSGDFCNRPVRSFTTGGKEPPKIVSPNTPAGTVTKKIHPWSLEFEWTKVKGASLYRVDISTDPNFKELLLTSEVDLYDASSAIIDVLIDEKHYWRVAAAPSKGKYDDPSSPGYFETSKPKVIVTPISQTYPWPAVFQWKDVVGEANYIFELKQDALRWEDPEVVLSDSKTLPEDTVQHEQNLKADQSLIQYDWRVRVIGPDPYKEEGTWGGGGIVSKGYETVPERFTPDEFSCPDPWADISFKWETVPKAESYELVARQAVCVLNQKCTHGEALIKAGLTPQPSSPQVHTFDISSHLQGPTYVDDAIGYFWYVRAIGPGGLKGYDSWTTLTDPYMIQPDKPDLMNPKPDAEYDTDDSIEFTWTSRMAHGGGYVLSVYEDSDCAIAPMWSNVIGGNSGEISTAWIGNFDAGAHSWRVHPFVYGWGGGNDPCKTPQWSLCQKFRIVSEAPPPAGVPATPTVPTELGGSVGMMLVVTSVVPNADHYLVEVYLGSQNGSQVGNFNWPSAVLADYTADLYAAYGGNYNFPATQYFAGVDGTNPLNDYYYHVKACNANGCSNWSTWSHWQEYLPWPF